MAKKKKKKGGLDLIWLAVLPILLTLSILLALSIWSKAESYAVDKLGQTAMDKPTSDDLFKILEE